MARLLDSGSQRESAVAFEDSVYIFKYSLLEVEPFNCVKGGMKNFHEEKVSICG